MRIVHVYKDYFPVLGGIENHMRALAEGQAARGHDVTVLVTNPAALAAEERLNGVRVRRAQRIATVASTPLSLDLARQLHALRPQITHLHFPYPIGEMAQLLVGRQRPYVITYHSDVVRQQRLLLFYRPFLLRALHGSSRILATSEPYIRSSTFLAPISHKCSVVPLSVNATRYHDVTPLMPPAAHPTLLFVGRHRYYKGIDDLLEALVSVPGARLLLGGDGPMRPLWQEKANALGLSERVIFLGDVPDEDLPALYASADIFVLPANSRAEAFGKVLLEAMASGLPCITTELGTGTSYVVQDGVTGLVAPPRQPAALANAIKTLLKDESLRRQMGERGRRRVLQQFTTEQMVQKVDAVYRSIVGADDKGKELRAA